MTAGLEFFNGHGGFDSQSGEYVIIVPGGAESTARPTPRPWINVIANPGFGFLISETGAGSTWHRNSREHRLTPWHNDPLVDPHGDAFFVRDETDRDGPARREATGGDPDHDEPGPPFWSLFPGPAPGGEDYEVRHGFGRTQCRHASGSLLHEVETFVPLTDPLRITTVRLTNRSAVARRLSLFAYYRLVLGGIPVETAPHVVTAPGRKPPRVVATNPASLFPAGVAFADIVAESPVEKTFSSGDRRAFIGEGGSLRRPAAVAAGAQLNGSFGAGLDPCFAQQVVIRIPPGETFTGSFLFGEGDDEAHAEALCERYRAPGAIEAARKEVVDFWTTFTGRIRISTPSPAIDRLVNGWLPYQTLACRLWARSALYQSGGAFGFRDQLQDAAALVHLAPELTRAQILLHAAHQFVEGDVLHWWHPPRGAGIRTRFADDLLWLPCLTGFYVATTGDWEILDQPVPFLSSRPLAPGEDEAYLQPDDSGESADLYEHCARALDRSLRVGAHGLPLFGSGDWNDGLNRVGREGRGESVWMAFFLHYTLGEFLPACERRNDRKRIVRYAAHRAALAAAVEKEAWDGDWYRRGFYDDGTPLGSRSNDECRIDALPQAWAVISGVASRTRAEKAMASLEKHLVSEEDRLIRLLTPPFENCRHDPGYIKGYLPGVRENGGQYTHAALWVVMAMGRLGRHDRVARWLEMLNPISHTLTADDVARYGAEPYVVAADVYSVPPHAGRAGWTWYTGSAGWMYRVALETLLGFRIVEGTAIHLKPCIPDDWPAAALSYRIPGTDTRYEIRVVNPAGRCAGVVAARLDGAACEISAGTARIPLQRDSLVHAVDVTLG